MGENLLLSGAPILQRQLTMGEDELTQDSTAGLVEAQPERSARNSPVSLTTPERLQETSGPVETNSSSKRLKRNKPGRSSVKLLRQHSLLTKEEQEALRSEEDPDAARKATTDVLGVTPKAFRDEGEELCGNERFSASMFDTAKGDDKKTTPYSGSPPLIKLPSEGKSGSEILQRQESWKEDVSDAGWRAW